jgi:hypothetical protein
MLILLGWLVKYLVRNANLGSIGYALTGLHRGALVSRVTLAELTYRFGQRRIIFIYAVICVALRSQASLLAVRPAFFNRYARVIIETNYPQCSKNHCRSRGS